MIFKQLTASLMAITVALAFHSCSDNKKPTFVTQNFMFDVANLSTDKEITATSGSTTIQMTTMVVVDGVSTTITRKSNELPVRAGDIVEVRFSAQVAENTEAYFTMPDGKVVHATTESPTLKWTIPSDFKSGMQIKGETSYETDEGHIKSTGTITLIAF